MPSLRVDQSRVTPEVAAQLEKLCPFGAIHYQNKALEVDSGCKMCGLCTRKGPAGVMVLEETPAPQGPAVDKAQWRGVAVWAEHQNGRLHNVVFELIGKARQLAQSTGHPVYVVLAGHRMEATARELLRYGVDDVFVYDHPALENFLMEPYANVFADFIEKVKPSSVLVGATVLGRSLAPRVAARFRTGLTADCTVLEMRENTDLVQIRPAFGGNIMAQIITAKNRPQFCTARYKVFPAACPVPNPAGTVRPMPVESALLASRVRLLHTEEKPKEIDISEAKAIVAVGRGFKKQADLAMAQELADLLDARLACTRPLIESGWFDPRHQIGLSGRTVAAQLIVTLGISGAVQFAAGMKGCGCIIAVNSDENAPIFDVAQYAAVGDLYQVVPRLIQTIREVNSCAVS